MKEEPSSKEPSPTRYERRGAMTMISSACCSCFPDPIEQRPSLIASHPNHPLETLTGSTSSSSSPRKRVFDQIATDCSMNHEDLRAVRCSADTGSISLPSTPKTNHEKDSQRFHHAPIDSSGTQSFQSASRMHLCMNNLIRDTRQDNHHPQQVNQN